MMRQLILFDFDETYYKHQTTKEDIPKLRELESTLRLAEDKHQVITAVLSGSIFESIMEKMEHVEMEYKPHFIFSDLCSKLFERDDKGVYHRSKDYDQAVSETTFTKEKVDEIINDFESEHHVELHPQRAFRDEETLYEYYYYAQGDEAQDAQYLKDLQDKAAAYDYAVHYNKTNPKAGDPEDAYDVHFTPKNAGKLFAVRYLLDMYDLDSEEVLGFGDSGNDEVYLSHIGHPFVMHNSTDDDMKEKFPATHYDYYKGLNDEIKRFFDKRINTD